MSDTSAWLQQTWQPSFRHSAGALGSHYIRALRAGKLLGWKTARLGVTAPPIEAGSDGEWIEIGPAATLVGYASPDDLVSQRVPDGFVFAAVKVDGADTMMYALLRCDDAALLRCGQRLEAVFSQDEGGATVPVFRTAGAS